MYERRSHQLLSPAKFARRVVRHLLLGLLLIGVALGMGVVGYHSIVGLSWIDSLLNASMILGGMGPFERVKAFRFLLCVVFGARVCRHCVAHDCSVRPPVAAPVSS